MQLLNRLGLLIVIYMIPMIVIDLFLISETDYINFFATRVPDDLIEDFISETIRWKWLAYPFTILFALIKTLAVTSILWLGVFLVFQKQSFYSLWKASITAQIVFASKGYLLLLVIIQSADFDLYDLQAFHPLSLASFFDISKLEPYWLFLFQSISLFEIGYWFALAHLLSRLLKSNLSEGVKFTLSTYLPFFGLWLIAVTFFIVSNT